MDDLRGSGLRLDDTGKWFVTTGLFKNGGTIVAGPFPTRIAAVDDRETTERSGGSLELWIDQAPQNLIRFDDPPQLT